jgi:hypothetical protein
MQTLLLGVSFALLSVIWYPTPYALADDTRVARGTVVAIGGSSLTIKVRDQEMKFSIDPKTVVEARGAGTKTRTAQATGKPGPKLADVLTVGTPVAVTYHEVGTVLHASNVRALSTTPAAENPTGSGEVESMTSTGTVQAIGGNSITISGGSGGGAMFTQTFTIDERTKVFAKGAGTAAAAKGGRVPFTEIVSNGDHVSVSYRKVGDRLVASDVRVTLKAMH